MTASLLISYKNSERPYLCHPFSFEAVLTRGWLPLAQNLNLPILQMAGCILINQRCDAVQLIDELCQVRKELLRPDQSEVYKNDINYMIERIDQIIPLIEQAISEWEEVLNISL